MKNYTKNCVQISQISTTGLCSLSRVYPLPLCFNSFLFLLVIFIPIFAKRSNKWTSIYLAFSALKIKKLVTNFILMNFNSSFRKNVTFFFFFLTFSRITFYADIFQKLFGQESILHCELATVSHLKTHFQKKNNLEVS